MWWLPAALRRPQKKHAPGILEHVSCVLCRLLLIFVDFYYFLLVLGSPSPVRLVVAACGASATSEKTRPWIFGTCILWMLSIFVDFRSPKWYLEASAGGVAHSPRQLRGGAPGTNFGRSGELGQHRENPIQINLFGEKLAQTA